MDGEYINDMRLALSEVHSRNALTIVITDCADKLLQVNDKIDFLIPVK